MSVPPQKGYLSVDCLNKATCQGYSFSSVSMPFTILVDLFACPQTQLSFLVVDVEDTSVTVSCVEAFVLGSVDIVDGDPLEIPDAVDIDGSSKKALK